MVKVLQSQSVIDLAIQTAGSAKAAFALAVANGLSITDDLTAGSDIELVDVVDRDITAYYVNKSLTPATASNVEATEDRFWFPEMPKEF